MSRMRSLSLPKLSTPKDEREHRMSSAEPLYHFAPTHSRDSSGASSASASASASTSSPITSGFSSRSHDRGLGSSSSLATTPDSPVSPAKPALQDVVEDPAERDDGITEAPLSTADEPLCICDTPFCEHRRTDMLFSSVVATPAPDPSSGDDRCRDGELSSLRSIKRRRSVEPSAESLTTRLSRRWPSLSNIWRDQIPTTAVSNPIVRSAPPSRASSLRTASLKQSLATHLESGAPVTPPYSPVDGQPEDEAHTRPRAWSRAASKPLEIKIPESPAEDFVDLPEPVSTPLLPPMMAEHRYHSSEKLHSPLQSPSVAEPTATASVAGSPTMTPILSGMPSPPLSSKPSVASIHKGRQGHVMHLSSEIPPITISEETDPWAVKLGHANFHITPEPYYPEGCNLQACKRLLDDWESARLAYMYQAARISENYGPTSEIYRLTEQKWAEIDVQWRTHHDRANAEAQASSETTMFQPLAETQPLSKMPSLNDPEQPAKFPEVDEADIVGPMVKYAKIQQRPSKKPTLLKLFTDPASLLGKRSPFGLRR